MHSEVDRLLLSVASVDPALFHLLSLQFSPWIGDLGDQHSASIRLVDDDAGLGVANGITPSTGR
jgi:hypothetical protein